MRITAPLSGSGPNDLPFKYRALLEKFCSDMSVFGYRIVPYRSKHVDKFKTLPYSRQLSTFQDLQRYVGLYDMAVKERVRPDNEGRLLWYAIRMHGYRPTPDLMDKVEDDDFIEVYNNDNIQIHRSFNYFRLSSYELDEVFVNAWWELYERDPEVEKGILALVQDLFSGKVRETILADLPNHYLREAFSSERRVYCASHNYFSPLFDKNNRATAFVVLSKARVAQPEEYPDRFKRRPPCP